MDARTLALVRHGGGKLTRQAMVGVLAMWGGLGRPYGIVGHRLWFITALAHGAGELHVRVLPAQEFFCPACDLSHPLASLHVEHTRSATRFVCPSTGELLCEV
jgi:hypothetical protein